MPELPTSAPASAAPTAKRASSPLARWGFGTFLVGLLAVGVIMVLFATGSHDLPLWLNLLAMLAPIGFGIGLLGVFGEARAARGRAAGSANGQPGLTPMGRS
ncbi:MAG: hypothetical protein ABWZ02_08275 [Nakamurella sp.]